MIPQYFHYYGFPLIIYTVYTININKPACHHQAHLCNGNYESYWTVALVGLYYGLYYNNRASTV